MRDHIVEPRQPVRLVNLFGRSTPATAHVATGWSDAATLLHEGFAVTLAGPWGTVNLYRDDRGRPAAELWETSSGPTRCQVRTRTAIAPTENQLCREVATWLPLLGL